MKSEILVDHDARAHGRRAPARARPSRSSRAPRIIRRA
jgi:hypothetical protein